MRARRAALVSLCCAALASCGRDDGESFAAYRDWVTPEREVAAPGAGEDLSPDMQGPDEVLWAIRDAIGGDAVVVQEAGELKVEVRGGSIQLIQGIQGPHPGGVDIVLHEHALELRGQPRTRAEKERLEAAARAHAGDREVVSRLEEPRR